jgi:hypothetical protein
MYLSQQTININGFDGVWEFSNKSTPWEIEVLALFSLYSEDGSETIDLDSVIDMINAIRENFDNQLIAQNDGDIAEKFMILASALQFPVQENNYIKLYRCKFFYDYKSSEIDMKKLFLEMFGVSYDEVMKFYIRFNYLLTLPREINTSVLKFSLINSNRRIIKHFAKSINDYKDIQNQFVSSIYDYQKCFRVFYQFPFILDTPLMYTPVPHLHINTFTNSLLFRLTNNDNNVRRKFGKNVLEGYLLHMFEEYTHIDDFCPEIEYKKNKSKAKSPDLLAYKKELCLLIDSKSFVPHLKLRDVTKEEIDYSINIVSEGLVKLYKQVAIDSREFYNPFNRQFCKKSTFGILLLLEDSFIIREKIYQKAADELGLKVNTEEYDYLRSNIVIMSLYNLEDIIYHNIDIFELMIKRREESFRWNNFPIVVDDTVREIMDSRISEIESTIKRDLNCFIDEMVGFGFIPRTEYRSKEGD